MRKHLRTVHACHRRLGKTRFESMVLFDAALRHPPVPDTPGRFAYVAPLLKQAKAACWVYLKSAAGKINAAHRQQIVRVHESELFIEFRHNLARVTLHGASKPDDARGIYLDGAVIDEPGQMNALMWTEVILPMLLDHDGWATFIGTPKGINFFHKLFHEDALQPGWGRTLIRASETRGTLPWLSPEKLETLKRDMSDIKYAQEMECDWNASAEDVVITINDVLAAQARLVLREDDLRGLPRVMGIDTARYRDRTVLVKRWGRMMYEPVIWKGGTDHTVIIGQIAEHIRTWKPDAVFIDKAQSGTIVDVLRQLGHEVVLVDFGAAATNPHYANKRAEMYATCGQWVREVGVLPTHAQCPELITELTSVTYDFNLSDQYRLESKDQIRERLAEQELSSPDIADALVLTFAYPVIPKDTDDNLDMILNQAGRGAKEEWVPSHRR